MNGAVALPIIAENGITMGTCAECGREIGPRPTIFEAGEPWRVWHADCAPPFESDGDRRETVTDEAAENTDREIWREREGDFYAPSIFVTRGGGIGINVGGMVIVKPLREWHRLAASSHKRDNCG